MKSSFSISFHVKNQYNKRLETRRSGCCFTEAIVTDRQEDRHIHTEASKKNLPEFLFILVRSPCKILEPYDNPFWGFEQRYQQGIKKRKKINYLK
jgi:hypothetical protein